MGLTDTTFVVKDKEATDVGRFLNRILGLSVEKQNLVSVDRAFLFKQKNVIKRQVKFHDSSQYMLAFTAKAQVKFFHPAKLNVNSLLPE